MSGSDGAAAFRAWLGKLPDLVKSYVGLKEALEASSPPQWAAAEWQTLVCQRDDALNGLSDWYKKNYRENSLPGDYPWIAEFIGKVYSLPGPQLPQFDRGREYLLPVAESFRDLVSFQLLNIPPKSELGLQRMEWEEKQSDVEQLIRFLSSP